MASLADRAGQWRSCSTPVSDFSNKQTSIKRPENSGPIDAQARFTRSRASSMEIGSWRAELAEDFAPPWLSEASDQFWVIR